MRHTRLVLVGVVAALTALLPLSPAAGTSSPASPEPAEGGVSAAAVAPRLAIDDDFPDPEVIVVGDTYHAYSTSSRHGRVPHATAPGPDGPWTIRGDVLPDKPAWTGDGGFWAPDVSQRADGRYLMYFTGPDTASGRMCLGAALADSPDGPFLATSDRPLVCDPGEGGDIDPSSFVDSDGSRYLLYKNDGNAIGQPTIIWLQRVEADGITFVGGRTELLRNNLPSEDGVIEAPVLVKRASHYVLFYSAGVYTTPNYQTSYATSASLTGPYTRAYRPLMTTASLDGAVSGPGGADIGDGRIFFHGALPAGGRGLYVADLGWDNDYPVVRGSRVRHEAERGTLNNASVRQTGTASQGAVAAGIDFADSWVDIRVFAASAGPHTLHIGYAAGYGEAQHALSVNGQPAGTVTYPDRGWENWTEVSVDVDLTAGANTIRLGHLSRWAELDYVEVS
ncbi:family 43 glycosylhydrolase [Streptomyces sp. 3MP-14]|uniref:Family 43 glycosylhydrolase n=1 Tax=Streptomyces mimosae TaxID=2586635 RepID=A0A5N5ZXH3_9ACTN|nr:MULTISPECIES: family 43 glycosylhydrolase [Streptomyces]KAB8161204.1 family 43 glycosylhydrolase [Streptomyces mimosae]KAB8179015.1 family 43 glycosylhydrolase [Streptomyces sp. 3MP-14]